MLLVIYLRVSTEEQAKKGFSLPSQRDACRARAQAIARTAEAGGARVDITEFVDTFGGDVLERPVLEELRAFVQANRPDWFICMDPDRFSRNLTAQLLITDEIERAGTQLAFVQHNYEKSAEGRLFYQLRGAVAEFEKAKILERTARGKRRKLREGRRSNGVAPYGYRHNSQTDELEVHEPEAQWIRLIFQWVAREHLTYYQLVRRLRDLGVATKKGGTWREATVAYLLKNTAYVGQMVCNRYDSEGKSAYRRLPRAKREPMTHRIRPETEWITAPVPAIIDQATFDAVQRLLAAHVRRGGPRNANLLSMLLRCGRCGSGMAYNRKDAGGRTYIRCNRRFADLRHYAEPARCTMPPQRADPIEKGVWETVCGWLMDPGLHVESAESQKLPERQESDTAEIAALEQLLIEKQHEQALIIRKQLKQLITEKAADAMLADVAEQIANLEVRLARLRERGDHRQSACHPPDLPPADPADTGRRLARLTHEQRVRLIRQLVQTVTVNAQGSWTITTF